MVAMEMPKGGKKVSVYFSSLDRQSLPKVPKFRCVSFCNALI